MPPNGLPSEVDEIAEKKRLAEEKKQLKKEKKAGKKEVKSRAKELVRQERELEKENDPKGASVFFVTLVIVVIWLAILALLVKLDVGGFGSGILQPILKDIPVINRILPTGTVSPQIPDAEPDSYHGYTDIRDAVDTIRQLEHELDQALSNAANLGEENAELRAQVARLKEFEDRQVWFHEVTTAFAEEVVYHEKGPGPEGFAKYFEAIHPATAEQLYKQVIIEIEESNEIKDFARTFSEMKPKDAAGILEAEAMTANMDTGVRILKTMNAADRGAILGVMDADIAAQYTKLMEPR
jgi:flagellar motility protein MotE (MotC chaperone)